MPHVVTENCVDCRYTDCVEVCPVDCFYADNKMLYIHPDDCIDCGACVPECPVNAIFDVFDLPEHLTKCEKINAERVNDKDVHNIFETESPLPTAEAKRKKISAN